MTAPLVSLLPTKPRARHNGLGYAAESLHCLAVKQLSLKPGQVFPFCCLLTFFGSSLAQVSAPHACSLQAACLTGMCLPQHKRQKGASSSCKTAWTHPQHRPEGLTSQGQHRNLFTKKLDSWKTSESQQISYQGINYASKFKQLPLLHQTPPGHSAEAAIPGVTQQQWQKNLKLL